MDTLTIRTKITAQLLKQKLFQGSIFSAIGALLILICGTYLPSSIMSPFGFIIICLALFCIAVGMIPYRRLSKLQLSPHKLLITERDCTVENDKSALYSIPLISINTVQFIQKGSVYGIALTFHKPIREKICVHSPQFDIAKLQSEAHRRFDCDLFLAFYPKEACAELTSLIEECHAS